MRLILFDTDKSEFLYPLTHLRPSFDLKIGFDTLGDKIGRAAGTYSSKALFVREILETVTKERNEGVIVNDASAFAGDDLLVVDGRVLVTKAFGLPDGDCVVKAGDDVVIAKVSAATASTLPSGGIEEFMAAAAEKCPVADADIKLMAYPWDLIIHNPDTITADFEAMGKSGIEGSMHPMSCIYGPEDRCYIAPGAEIHPTVVIDTKHGPVYIDEDVEVFPHTRVEGPSYIGKGTQLVGGKIREGCSIGPVCKVGGEVEEAIIHGYSNKYHDGFLGHAYVCEWVNLGALTTNSDLKNDYGSVEVKVGGVTYDTGSTKIGSFIGDHTKTSIGTLLNTGSSIGCMCLLMASGAPMPKFIPSFSWFLNGRFSRGAGYKSLLKTAYAATSRRKRDLTEADVELLKAVYDLTKEERSKLVRRDSLAMLKK